MGWTKEQEKAIHTPTGAGNLLVSAAAGSGKTAVLVERILQKLINGETTIDRLLVVTFTEAAASEMREKIIKRLVKQMKENPSDAASLKGQIRLAESADIMTIDAFCNRVVQNNFHTLGIDPGISIADDAMCDIIRDEAMENVYDTLYTTENVDKKERFDRLIDAYASNRSDFGLTNVVFAVYTFISSFAEPEKWLDDAEAMYHMPVYEMPFAKQQEEVSRTAARSCIDSLDKMVYENEEIIAASERMRDVAEGVLSAKNRDEIYEVYKTHFAQDCPSPLPVHAELDFIRFLFEEGMQEGVTKSAGDMETQSHREILSEEVADLVWIVKLFMNEYAKVKDKYGVREFSDIEHLTYELFRSHKDIRKAYTDKYDEILIDEYQDTNSLQDSIFSMISHNNIFMVGDLKQSIYRFRGGDPYIFKDKSIRYDGTDCEDNKIVLSQNFRSRIEILNSVNDIFGCIMSSEAGDVEYCGNERIVREPEREYYPNASSDCTSELHYLIMEPGIKDKEAEEIRFTADKIKEILDSGVLVYDKDEDCMRPIRKKDIVILENSVKNNGSRIVKALEERGIDAYTNTESFFSRREIKIMLSLISVINNARQDIPLIAVMRSPIGGFSENELTRIKLNGRKRDNFITAVRLFAKGRDRNYAMNTERYTCAAGIGKPQSKYGLRMKCRKFISQLRRWRGYVRNKSVAQLIWAIYEETYFYDMMGAIEHGEEAQFNLRLLYERARRFEAAGFRGLFNYIKYIERIEDHDDDLGGAKTIGENHDVVRIMTIHKSKGLEFPYVFLIGAGKRFSAKSSTSSVRMHKELGLGMPYIRYQERIIDESITGLAIKSANKRELISENMRVLYVALTRAREKLFVIMRGNSKKEESSEELDKKWQERIIDGKMLPGTALSAGGFYDWLCPAAVVSKDTWKFTYHKISGNGEEPETEADTENEDFEDSPELRRAVYEILDYSYPYTKSRTIPSRTSVTQLKELDIERRSEEEPELTAEVYEPDSRRTSGAEDMADLMFSPLRSKPAFMREKGEKPANEIGTLYHLVMSEINPEIVKREGTECIEAELCRLVDEHRINAEDLKYIKTERIAAFFESDLGKSMLKSKELHREQAFQINISASEYDPSLEGVYEDETLILQGIIDCYFGEPDGYVLIDFKTDKIIGGNIGALREKYNKQLELYKRAIEKLTGKKVKEQWLYSFDAGSAI